MNPATPEEKKRLRAKIRARLSRLDPSRRREASTRLCHALLEMPEFLAARKVLGFCPLPAEPDVQPALRYLRTLGAVICLPRWNPATSEYLPAVVISEDELVPGPFEVPEPPPTTPLVPWAELDLVLVPGLAFDPMGRRLGRGRGYFDRILSRAPQARRWGLAFGVQVVDVVPAEPHDIHMHVLVTPERTWSVSSEVSS